MLVKRRGCSSTRRPLLATSPVMTCLQAVDMDNHSWANYFLAAYKAGTNHPCLHARCCMSGICTIESPPQAGEQVPTPTRAAAGRV